MLLEVRARLFCEAVHGHEVIYIHISIKRFPCGGSALSSSPLKTGCMGESGKEHQDLWTVIEQHEEQIKTVAMDSQRLVDRVKRLEKRLERLEEQIE